MHSTTAYERLQTAAAVVAGFLPLFLGIAPADAASKAVKEFYIKTVHVDGKTSTHGDDAHAPEAFPKETMPGGGGLVLTRPNKKGKWRMRAFAFLPSQITVHQGDRVRLKFIGVQGPRHTIHVEGEAVDKRLELQRGYLKTVEFTAGKPGVVSIECYDHQPSMTGQVLILPKR